MAWGTFTQLATLVGRRETLEALPGATRGVPTGSFTPGRTWACRGGGYYDARQYNLQGFYYILPDDSGEWRSRNYACVWLFSPLNAIDCWLGTGRPRACEPLGGLSK